MATWTKTSKDHYEATINGRCFVLQANRKTRSRSVRNKFGFGSHRVSSSTTWYNVYERMPSGEWVDRNSVFSGEWISLGSIQAAKEFASKIAFSN